MVQICEIEQIGFGASQSLVFNVIVYSTFCMLSFAVAVHAADDFVVMVSENNLLSESRVNLDGMRSIDPKHTAIVYT